MDEQNKELQNNSPFSTQTSSNIPQNSSVEMNMQTTEVQIENPSEPVPAIEIPTLRTYKTDIHQTVNKDKITTAKILIAEQNKNKKTETQNFDNSIKRPTNILVLILSIILIITALGGIGYFGYTKTIKPDIQPIAVAPQTFLFVFDSQKFVNSANDIFTVKEEIDSLLVELKSASNNSYTDIVFYKTNPETDENSRITSREFFALLDIAIPTNIVRSIGQEFTSGAYTMNQKAEPFIVLDIVDYPLLYSNIFNWESTIALDIKDLFPNFKNLFDIQKIRENVQRTIALNNATTTATSTTATSTVNATTTATTTEPVLSPEEQIEQDIAMQNTINRNIRFIDTVFSNKTARVVRDVDGNILFYYAFIDKTKILFAQDPVLVGEITRKMKEKSLVR